MADYDPKSRRRRPTPDADEPAAVDALLEAVDHAPATTGVNGTHAPTPASAPESQAPESRVPEAQAPLSEAPESPGAGVSASVVSLPVAPPDAPGGGRTVRKLAVAAVIAALVAVAVVLVGRRRR